MSELFKFINTELKPLFEYHLQFSGNAYFMTIERVKDIFNYGNQLKSITISDEQVLTLMQLLEEYNGPKITNY